MRHIQHLPEIHAFAIYRCLLFLLLPILTPGFAFSSEHSYRSANDIWQNRRIEGKVTDMDGDPLSGVTVHVKGTARTVTTNSAGEFSIDLPDLNSVLVFTYVGMETYETEVSGNVPVVVQLKSRGSELSDVVVVGYSTQKKVNLTGSVTTVTAKTLMERPTPNAVNLLQGRVAGLRVTQPTGQPGKDEGILQIRGLGSFGASSSPLVLVDGIIGSISNLSPNDIENVTVLKDAASASIYGSRAANGVILVTTKQGAKGRTSIEYKADVGFHNATKLPDLIYNSAEYMQLFNEAALRSGQTPIYTQEQINAYKNPSDPEQFPSFNWMDHYYNQATAINHYLSISGGSDKTTYKLSLSYLDQDGILPRHNFKRYNALLNLNSKITKGITIGTTMNMVYKDITEPWAVNDNLVLAIYQHGPNYKPYLPDGSGRISLRAYKNEPHNTVAPLAFYGGGQYSKGYALNTQAYINVDIVKGLSWQVKGGVNYADDTYKNHQFAIPVYLYQKLPGETDYTLDHGGTPSALGVTDRYTKTILPTLYSLLTYDTRIGSDHGLKVMAGYEQQSYRNQFLQGYKNRFPTPELQELNAGASDGQTAGGSASEWALRSVFGRINYDFKGKYLVEANARYDGTSRVSGNNRWGFFPSVSVGWKMSSENFMKNISWLDELKLRGSLGKLGNQEIGFYPYQDILNLTNYAFNSSVNQAVALSRLTDKNLKWESTRVLDLGLDMNVMNGLFGLTFDWFRKKTFDILTTLPVPSSLGLSGPVTNDGKLLNTGWEAELRHGKRFGDFSYGVNLILSTYKNELLQIRTPTIGVNEVGLPYGSYYMYEWIGIFQSQDEINKSPTQVLFPPQPGDLKIKDQNGDGLVDANDRITIAGAHPDYIYSFGMNAAWKGFGLSIFFQGVEGQKLMVNQWGYDPFQQESPPSTKFRNAWRPDNPSNTVPAVYMYGYGGVNAYNSTYHLQDASYLRLKNINLSYTFPKKITDKIKSTGVTVYISGDNLITITDYEGADPERSGSGRYAQFPQVRIINTGISIRF